MATLLMMGDPGSMHVSMLRLAPIILLLSALITVSTSDGMCGFLDNEAVCDVLVASKYPIHMRATINQCSQPLDVTFHIKVINASWAWSHTFANRDEIQRLPGLDEEALLQVALESRRRGRLHVFAGFDVSSRPGQVVLDDTVVVQGLDECGKPGNPNAYLPLVVFIILLILIAALMATIVGFRRHRSNKRHSELLTNMEPSGVSYRDDPATISSTVIKNDIYRDTVTSISDPDGAAQHIASYAMPGDSANGGEFHIRPPPVPSGGGRRKRLLKNGLPQPVLERLPEEPGEDDSSSREVDAGINPAVTVAT